VKKTKFYIVDVFASNKYEGNQLAVFVDLENQVSEAEMQRMATEINFAETTFIKADKGGARFVVRIFTPEHEVPFAGHPSIGTSYVIARFILPKTTAKLVLELKHSDIEISILQPDAVDESLFFMRQAQPEFREFFTQDEISKDLGVIAHDLDASLPVQEISTGLPYIIIPLKNLEAIKNLRLDYDAFQRFLEARQKYRTNSATGHSTSLFFFTEQTYEPENQYNARMLLLENGRLSEDAATGSANGCLLAYLLKYGDTHVKATVEQGFEINRKSYIYLDGTLENGHYQLNVGGHTKLVSEGFWYV
jgi:trans-2,3-dihydro-3-hydroxyanthranilate isomerase